MSVPADTSGPGGQGWRHPVVPLLAFCLLSLVAGEFYPLSPFSMYSNPSPVPLRFCYVADGEGEPLPILWHTGVSPASLTKKYGHHRGEIAEAIERGDRAPLEDDAIRAEAGREVLTWLREISRGRPRRELTDPLQLVEIAVSAEAGGLRETSRVVAELE
ncbi:MAG: hypothetical protein JNK37_22865 [Verrucomicrobiales bacterium]|nr:hypothetical protein [Verrucomicrobiales bacterium]